MDWALILLATVGVAHEEAALGEPTSGFGSGASPQ